MTMTSSLMEKSMRKYLQLMVVLILSAAGGSANSVSDMNNSFNPYSSPTVVVSPSSSSSPSPSTSQTMLETYLHTFPINDTQNVLTTVHHQTHHHMSTVEGEKEKTTASNEMMYSTSYSSSTTRLTSLATESPQSTDSQAPVVNPSFSSILPTYSQEEVAPVIIEVPPHELLGCGPNNREAIGIQKVCIKPCTNDFHAF